MAMGTDASAHVPAGCVTLTARMQVIRGEGLIYMVMEYGDIDLARLLARHEAAQREHGALEPDENFIRLYWQQMLQARARLPRIQSERYF